MTTTVLKTKIGEVEKIIPDFCDLVTITILNIKIGKVENKIPDVSGLVTTAVPNKITGEFEKKIPDHAKYIVTLELEKSASSIFDKRFDSKNNVSQCADKSEEKMQKIQTFNLIFSCQIFSSR